MQDVQNPCFAGCASPGCTVSWIDSAHAPYNLSSRHTVLFCILILTSTLLLDSPGQHPCRRLQLHRYRTRTLDFDRLFKSPHGYLTTHLAYASTYYLLRCYVLYDSSRPHLSSCLILRPMADHARTASPAHVQDSNHAV